MIDPPASRRLRILQVILSRGFAGSERAVVETCNALSENNSVAVVVRRDHRSGGGASILDPLDRYASVKLNLAAGAAAAMQQLGNGTGSFPTFNPNEPIAVYAKVVGPMKP